MFSINENNRSKSIISVAVICFYLYLKAIANFILSRAISKLTSNVSRVIRLSVCYIFIAERFCLYFSRSVVLERNGIRHIVPTRIAIDKMMSRSRRRYVSALRFSNFLKTESVKDGRDLFFYITVYALT